MLKIFVEFFFDFWVGIHVEKSPWRLCIFCTYWLNHNCLVEEIIFQLHQLVSDSTKSNNRTSTSAHVKKDSDSTLKYAAMVTPTQQYSYKLGCGVVVLGVACLITVSVYFL